MEEKYAQLLTRLNEISDLLYAKNLLEWDQQTYMPDGAAEERSYLFSTLARLAHQKVTSDEIGALLEALTPWANQLEPNSDEARMVSVTRYQYEKETRVPEAWVSEFTRVASRAQNVWEKAKTGSDFELFRPYLENIIELRRQYAGFFAPYDHVYDPLLDGFERGLKTAEVQAIFAALRPRQVELVQAIGERQQVDDSFLRRKFDEQNQWDFGVSVISCFGYDWQRGRQDRSMHPFTINFGLDDVRITTRFDPERPASALFSTIHECGHALYEQGVNPAYRRTPLADCSLSMALHESQSRLWENLVGRSLPFWKRFYPQLQRAFPSELSDISLEVFYNAINRVQPTLIRVEADEATYNLHVMLRLELEIALMEGSLAARDLPEAWNIRMKEYLGLTPPDHAQGVLQDIHWSAGYFGYFPTYALGNLVAVQLWEGILTDVPDLEDQIEHGRFDDLLGWLRKNIHNYGAKFNVQEILKQATGATIDPQPYLRYLQTKYGAIYNL